MSRDADHAVPTPDCVDADAAAYRAYLDGPRGRLRLRLVEAGLRAAWPHRGAGRRRVLDVGCGPGDLGVTLAAEGHHVVLADSSGAMLALAGALAGARGVDERVVLLRSSVEDLEGALAAHGEGAPFDLVLCHFVLEYLAPGAEGSVLGRLCRLLGAGGTLSLACLNRHGEVLHAALGRGDMGAARHALEAADFATGLFSGRRRGYDAATLEGLLAAAGLAVGARRGVCIVADYRATEQGAGDDDLLALEEALSERHPFRDMGRYLHLVARRAGR